MPRARSTQLFILILLLAAVALGYNYFKKPFADRNGAIVAQPPEESAPEMPELSNIEQLYLSLSPEDKVSQLLAVPLVVDSPPENSTASAEVITPDGSSSAKLTAEVSATWIERYNPGFIVLFGEQIWKSQATQIVDTYRSLPLTQGRSLLPAVAVDHEGGSVQRLSGLGYTNLPSWRDFCRLDDANRTELLSQSSSELEETGIDIVFAPVLDLAASNFALGSRACGPDVETVASRSAELSEQFLAKGIMPVFKHFPGIGAVNIDLHRSFARTEVSDDQSEIFRRLMENFPGAGVMVTHVGVTNSRTPDIPCSLSEECVGALHRVFPYVLTFADGLDMDAAAYSTQSAKTLPEISVEAVAAGNNVLVYGGGVGETEMEEIRQAMIARYQEDQDFAAKVDASVQKIMTYKDLHQLIAWE